MKTTKDAKQRTEKTKYRLLALEIDPRFFRDGTEEDRNILRQQLDFGDVGYISSLLTMLSDEGKFERWRIFSTGKFYSFKRRASFAK